MKNTLLKLLALLTLVCMLLPMTVAEVIVSEPVEAFVAEEEAALTGEEEGVVEVEAANDAMLDYDDEDCDHEYTYTEIVFENATYTLNNEHYHTVSGIKYELIVCEDCDKTLSRTKVGPSTEDERHLFGEQRIVVDEDGEEDIVSCNQDVCSLCGYKCVHSVTFVYDSFDDDAQFKSNNNKTHTVTGTRYQITYCDNCTIELNCQKTENVTVKENHEYYDGYCERCGHKNTCKHKKTKKISDYSGSPDVHTGFTATDYNATYHIANHVWLYTWTICKDCGDSPNDSIKVTGPFDNVKEKHIYRNGKCGTCGHIQPPPAPTSVSIAKTATVKLGETLTLTPTLKPAAATTTYTWKSAKPAIAKVDANGIVTPVKEGSVKITVTTANKKKATITVKVVDPNKPTKVALSNGKKATLKVGETLQLNAVLTPDSAKTTFKWTSDKKAVASVDGNGLVTAKKAGKAKITVTTANKKKATITITVKK